MGSIGPAEILVVLVAALVFLGPKRLPEAARQLGSAMAELRRVSADLQSEVRGAFAEPTVIEVPDEVPDTAAAPELRPDALPDTDPGDEHRG